MERMFKENQGRSAQNRARDAPENPSGRREQSNVGVNNNWRASVDLQYNGFWTKELVNRYMFSGWKSYGKQFRGDRDQEFAEARLLKDRIRQQEALAKAAFMNNRRDEVQEYRKKKMELQQLLKQRANYSEM